MNGVLNSGFFRFAPALLIAIVVNIALFFLMQMMIDQRNQGAFVVSDVLTIDYVRSKEEPVQPERQRRPPPPKPEEPEPPKVERLISQAPAEAAPIPPVPPMDLSPTPDLGTGPYLGEIGAPSWINAGELTALVRIPPEYPAHARMRRIQGYVDVEFIVDTNGRVRDATVIEAQPPGVFDRAALSSIIHWKFEPRQRDGVPVEIIARQRIEFELSG